MVTCKDCIHYEACEWFGFIYVEEMADDCLRFKPKSRFIELPCEVGQTVWVIYNNKIIKGKAVALEIVIEKANILFIAGVNFFCGISMHKGFTFGTNVFLTKEEAEKALAERNKK